MSITQSLPRDRVRAILADVLLAEIKRLDLPSPSASFADACRIGTSQVDAADLADRVTQAAFAAALPGAEEVDADLICDVFQGAWGIAVRRSGVVPGLLSWDENGQRGRYCTYLLGYIERCRAGYQREEG